MQTTFDMKEWEKWHIEKCANDWELTVQINYISVLSNRKSEILSDFKIQMGQLTHLRQMNLVIVNKENKMIKETGKKNGKNTQTLPENWQNCHIWRQQMYSLGVTCLQSPKMSCEEDWQIQGQSESLVKLEKWRGEWRKFLSSPKMLSVEQSVTTIIINIIIIIIKSLSHFVFKKKKGNIVSD